ncbi:MAG: DEAD/DEAH box helicase [Candidatus Thorarchaeota archaeon]|jgi:replicative superfamily II helicase
MLLKITDLKEYNFLPEYLAMLEKKTSGELWPVQVQAIERGLLDFKWKTFLASAPHGCGKTLVAELAAVKKLHENPNALIMYLVPYKAMATEILRKFLFLQKPPFGREVGIWTGDQAFDGEPLIGSNFLVLTYELFQLMLRTDLEKVINAGLIIIDELHFIEEYGRGPRQEAAITRLISIKEHPPVLGLCSVVSNLDQVMTWLDCDEFHATTEWRLSPLFEGLINPTDKTVNFYKNGKKAYEEKLPIEDIVNNVTTLADCSIEYLQRDVGDIRPQILVFVPARSTARKTASLISNRLKEYIASDDIDLTENDIRFLFKKLDEVSHSSSPTISNIKKLLATGVAYHHAGLGRNLRNFIEEQFKENRISVLVSTTTLAIGVNLPASRVYFLETKAGLHSLSPIKYRNMAGRAGRPQYREKGESIIVVSYPLEMQSSFANYISNPKPDLESYLLRDSSETEGALLTWVLQGLNTVSELEDMIRRSFRPPPMNTETQEKIITALNKLVSYGFLEKDSTAGQLRYICTNLGHVAGGCGARPDDSRLLIMNLVGENLLKQEGVFDRLAALFYISLTSRFDHVFLGSAVDDRAAYLSYMSKINRSARESVIAAGDRTERAFFIASLLEAWISGKSLKEIGRELGADHSAEEVVERLVPNAIEMLQYYIIIAEKSGLEVVGSNEEVLNHLQTLQDCLEIGTESSNVELGRLMRGKENVREVIEGLKSMGINTPSELLDFPYSDYSEELAGVSPSDFFFAKARALYLVEDKEDRKRRYVRLLAMHKSVSITIVELLLSNAEQFEKGVRQAIDKIAEKWPDHLEAKQVRDSGAGSNLPRPESYLVVKREEESIRLCFEAKAQRNAKPIEKHNKALSPLLKCRGESTHRITIGWPFFSRELHSTAYNREVALLDSTTFALIYVWIRAGLLSIKSFLTTLNMKGIIQPDAFDKRVPRWWPSTPSF